MNKIKEMMFGVMLASVTTATAGGILTNTNQSIDFLRNPARDAAISLDGVYSNPAGVAFLPEGFHLGFNWQYAHQTRTITSTNPVFALGRKNQGQTTKQFEGVAEAAVIGVPDKLRGEAICIYVVPRPGARVDLKALRQYLLGRVAPYKVPREYFLVPELPKTGLGKVRKPELRKRAIEMLSENKLAGRVL